MIHLIDRKTNQVVIDYQLVYDIDSAIHLNFYADGLLSEAQTLFSIKTPFSKKGDGMLLASLQRFEEYESLFKATLEKEKMRFEIAKKMTKSIFPVHRLCLKAEREYLSGKIFLSTYLELYQSVVQMLSYKRFSDYCESHFASFQSEARTPSFLLRMLQALERLQHNLDDNEIQTFIDRHGYLFQFSIAESELETSFGIREYLQRNPIHFSSLKKRQNHTGVTLFKQLAWYEELRHVYQLRALRNFRKCFQQMGLDIHEATIESIKGGVLG